MPLNPFSVEARHVPQFLRAQSPQLANAAVSAQRILWSAIEELLAGNDGQVGFNAIVNLSLVSDSLQRNNRLLFDIAGVDRDNSAAIAAILALPHSYYWQNRLEKIEDILTQSHSAPKWNICRIERRVDFIDLPWRRIESIDNQKLKTSSGSDARWFTVPTAARRLLTEQITNQELEHDRVAVPITGGLQIDTSSLRDFLSELRSEAPAAINISVSPINTAQLDNYRRVAMFWDAHLSTFESGIVNAGFADLQALRAQYSRFMLPDRSLCALTIRVAATSSSAARSIALHLVARLGGLRSFKIRDPVPITDLSQLSQVWNDVPHHAHWDSERWKKRLTRVASELTKHGIDLDLDPIFLEFLAELPHLYTFDEAAAVAELPVADEEGLPGFDARPVPPFTEPARVPQQPAAAPPPVGRLRIGIARTRPRASSLLNQTEATVGDWHTISPQDLTKHAFIVGSTGSGKTVTTTFIVRELIRLKTPFLVIEPVKTEYFSALKNIPGALIDRLRFEGNADGAEAENFVAFDPMRLQEGVSVSRHTSYLKSCFEAAFPLEPIHALILEAGIRAYYIFQGPAGCRLQIFSRGGKNAHRREPIQTEPPSPTQQYIVHPSLRGFRRFFLNYFLVKIVMPVKDGVKQPQLLELQTQWVQLFTRRFDAIESGMLGIAARKADQAYIQNDEMYDTFSPMLKRNLIFELDGIPDNEQKSLMMAFLMVFLFERRQADDLISRENDIIPSDALKHVLILEEAHRLLANPKTGRGDQQGGAQSKSVATFVDMLAEIRSFGQSMIIVEQIPTKVVPEAVKNTNLKIMLRLTAADDRDFLGAAMNFTEEQKRFVTSLRAEAGRGIDMVVFEQQLEQPRLLELPLPLRDGQPLHAALFD